MNQKMSFERLDQNSSRACVVWAPPVHTQEDLHLGQSVKFGSQCTCVLSVGATGCLESTRFSCMQVLGNLNGSFLK